jgi:hypothetical protein
MLVPADQRLWQEALALTDAGCVVLIIRPKGPWFERSHEVSDGNEIHRHCLPERSGLLGHLGEYAWVLACELVLTLRIYARTRFHILPASSLPDTIFLIARSLNCSR